MAGNWQNVQILDKPLRALLKRYADQMAGRRSWKLAKSFVAFKTGILSEPFDKKGISEEGRTNTWADNADSTVIEKYRLYKPGQKGKTPVPSGLKRKSILIGKTRALKNGLKVRFKKVGKTTRGPEFGVRVVGPASRYSGKHLNGEPGRMQTMPGRTIRKKNGEMVKLPDKEIYVKYPARPWAAWTPKDVAELRRQVQEWAVKESRIAGG